MQLDRTAEAAQRLNARLMATSCLLAASVALNLLMGGLVFTARQTVLVPMLPSEVALSASGGVSYDYLESLARDTAYLFLNRTPDNNDYFEQQLLKIAEPSTYQSIRAELSDERRHTMSGHVTQTFIPNDWYVDPAKLYVETRGTLTRSNGTEAPEITSKIYALQFARHGMGVRLRTFEDIPETKSLGRNVKVTPPPPPTVTPIADAETR